MSHPFVIQAVPHPSGIDPAPGTAAGERWLLPVAPPNERVADMDDASYAVAAHAAIDGDRDARDALYAAFAPRLQPIAFRVVRRLSGGGVAFEVDDALQESYLVFVQMVERWNGASSFTAYVTALFAHRLRDALLRSAPALPVTVARLDLLADGSHDAEEARILLEELSLTLPQADAVVLLAHIRDGESLSAIARRTGLSRRTIQRRWTRVVARLRRSLELPPR